MHEQDARDQRDTPNTKKKNITERSAWGHLVDDTSLAAGLDSDGLLENRLGLLDVGGNHGSGAVLLGNLLAEIDAVVGLVPEGGGAGLRAEKRS